MAMMYKKNWKQKSVFIWILTFNSIKLRNKKQVTQLNEHGTQKVYKRTRPKYIKHWMPWTWANQLWIRVMTSDNLWEIESSSDIAQNESEYITDFNIKKL